MPRLNELDRAIDPQEILGQVELAQDVWRERGEEVPVDSHFIAGLCRRLIVAEAKLKALAKSAVRPRRFENGSVVYPLVMN